VNVQVPEELGGETIQMAPSDDAGIAQRMLHPFLLAVQLAWFVAVCVVALAYYHLTKNRTRGETA